MIAEVMRLGDRPVRAVMTPRRQVDMLNLSDSAKAIRATIAKSPHSHLPVYETDPDQVLRGRPSQGLVAQLYESPTTGR